jgi:hypothetical protein
MRILGALAVAAVLSSFSLAFQQGPQPSLPAKLPTVTAYALDKAKRTLPADFSSPLNLLILSFQRDQQDAVESWIPVAKQPKVDLWLLPISSRQDVLYRWWLNSSMRSSLPANIPQHSTVPLYVNKSQFLKSLGIASEKQIVVLVSDRSGRVLWRSEGSATDDKKASLGEFLKTSPLAH